MPRIAQQTPVAVRQKSYGIKKQANLPPAKGRPKAGRESSATAGRLKRLQVLARGRQASSPSRPGQGGR